MCVWMTACRSPAPSPELQVLHAPAVAQDGLDPPVRDAPAPPQDEVRQAGTALTQPRQPGVREGRQLGQLQSLQEGAAGGEERQGAIGDSAGREGKRRCLVYRAGTDGHVRRWMTNRGPRCHKPGKRRLSQCTEGKDFGVVAPQ